MTWIETAMQINSTAKKQNDPKCHQRIGNTLQVGIIARE